MKMKNRKMAVSLACQIVFEYPGWGDEHVSDMYQTYTDCGDRPPCTADELMDLCCEAEKVFCIPVCRVTEQEKWSLSVNYDVQDVDAVSYLVATL